MQTLTPHLKIVIFSRSPPRKMTDVNVPGSILDVFKLHLEIVPMKNFVPLQTLFPYLKIVIFCRIVPMKKICNI